MKKKFIIALLFCTVLITGCGCGKKENKKTLVCNSELDEYNEKKVVTTIFEDDFLISEKIEIVIVFEKEEYAKQYYDMYKDSETEEISLDGKNVVIKQEESNESKNQIFEYNNFYNRMIEDGYSCELK